LFSTLGFFLVLSSFPFQNYFPICFLLFPSQRKNPLKTCTICVYKSSSKHQFAHHNLCILSIRSFTTSGTWFALKFLASEVKWGFCQDEHLMDVKQTR
jgi:hypothetical protein